MKNENFSCSDSDYFYPIFVLLAQQDIGLKNFYIQKVDMIKIK